jgi:hypothetical protein
MGRPSLVTDDAELLRLRDAGTTKQAMAVS